jgi:hypothetical protein
LSTGFAALDAEEAVSVQTRPGETEWWGCIASHGISYHTGRDSSIEPQEQALHGERRRVRFLKRKLLQDFAAGEKVFVRRDPGRTVLEMEAVLGGLRRHGPCDLLWVDQAASPECAGGVTLEPQGFARGTLGHFFPLGAADPEGLRVWLNVLDGALRLLRPVLWMELLQAAQATRAAVDEKLPSLQWRCLSVAASDWSDEIPRLREGVPVMRHRLLRETGGDTGLTICCEARGLQPGCLYVVSAWVWVGQAFTGWIGMIFPGLPWIKIFEADMAKREVWQRIVTSVRLPAECAVCYSGIVAAAASGSEFFSTGWRLERGVTPAA